MTSRSRKTRNSQQTAESSSREEISIHDSDDDIIGATTSTTTKRTVSDKRTTIGGSADDGKPMATSTPAQHKEQRSHRAASPLSISRTEEKDELSHLNDRLATYIDYVRSLEMAKEKLTKRVQSISKSETFEVDKIKKVYEDELKSLRKMVDELAQERANLEIELKNARDDLAVARKKYDRREAEFASLQRKLEALERDVTKQRADSERYMALLGQHDSLEKRAAKLSKDLDAEILLRTDIENKNVTLREQLEFNERVYNEERAKARKSQVVIEEEIQDRKQAEFECRLAEELRAIRDETADEFEKYKLEFEQSFVLRLNDLKRSSEHTAETNVRTREEMLSWRSKAEKLDQELASRIAENEVLKKRIKDLESLLTFERNEFESQLKRFRDESDQLRDDLQKRLEDFSNLMSTKIALDQEILMYRKLLEGEEARCNISVTADGDSSFTHIAAGSKRRRMDERGEYVEGSTRGNFVSSGRDNFKINLINHGPVEFTTKPDCSGRCVKLINNSDKDICIGGWTLRHVADSHETSYKFHHNLHIKPKSDCTIWSSDANETHNPPSDLVMKGQRFFSGNNIKMSLVNSENQEQASCILVKDSTLSSSYNRKIATRTIRSGEDSKCSMM